MKAHGLNPRVRRRHIEGGILDHASDMTPAENPLEMGMERLVDWDKPDFLGNAALERIRDEGVSQRVTGVFMSGPAFERNNEHRWPVTSDGRRVGAISSAVFSPRVERNIGIALLDVPFDDNDAPLRVETPEGVRKVERAALPFIDPDKSIPRRPLR